MKTSHVMVALIGALFLMVVALGVSEAGPTRTASLTWGGVTQDTEGNTITGVTYSVYQGVKGSASKTRVASNLTSLSYLVTNLPYGETCFNVTASAAGGESAYSAEGCKSFAVPKPVAPGSLVVE